MRAGGDQPLLTGRFGTILASDALVVSVWYSPALIKAELTTTSWLPSEVEFTREFPSVMVSGFCPPALLDAAGFSVIIKWF